MSEPIISVSGLRGIIGQTLTPPVAARYVAAFASRQPVGPIVVTRDGRATGASLADTVCGALTAMGRDVFYGDVAATPTIGVLVRELNAAGGVQISASHNPPEYNGIKLFGESGRVVSADVGESIRNSYLQNQFDWSAHSGIGSCQTLEDTLEAHLKLVLATVDAEAIRQRRFRVLLDSNHGAGSALGKRLLLDLGCDVIALGDVPDGRFAHPPEPTAENLAGISEQVRDRGVDVAFCQDPDADRLALIDANGLYIGEEYTLAITLQHCLSQCPGPVVTNCATSRMSQDIAAAFDCPIHLSQVGEANVTDEMIRVNAVYGGEGNGGPIDPRVGFVRDSFVGMAQTLDAMVKQDCPLHEIVPTLPKYAIVKSKASIDGLDVEQVLDQVAAHFPAAKASRQDGLRLDWENRWLLVRASNTEPIVRIIAEAQSTEDAQAAIDAAANVIAGAGS